MFHPIGTQPPSVYWRRRLVVIASVVLLIVLLVLTVNAIRSDGNGQAQAGSPTSSAGSTNPSSSVPVRSTSSSVAARRTLKSSSARSSGQHGSPTKSTTTAAPPADCAAGDLALKAVTQHTSYKVGDSPYVQLQVTNTGPKPCVQNLADQQVELRIYNGESRVWGSHDCKVAPGTAARTLNPKVSVLVSIKWSGLTSQPGCAGTRQRVGAGTYTLYGSLSGHQAGATQFTIS